VFESGSDPTIVGQAAYNTAYGSSFVTSGYCSSPGNGAGAVLVQECASRGLKAPAGLHPGEGIDVALVCSLADWPRP
jgi:hypothetical protein